jgi:hypothetical protein
MSYIFTCVPKDGITNEKLEMAINVAIPEMAKELYNYDLQINFIQPDKIEIKTQTETDAMPISLDECKTKFRWIFMDPQTNKTYPEFWFIKT